MSSITQRFRRRLLAVGAAGAVTAGALVFAATPAQAAPATTIGDSITGATLTWNINNEQGGGAFFGGCNFLSAGVAGDTGSSRLWTEADGFYKTVDGNVTIEKPDAEGTYAQPTWSTKCQDSNGTPVTPFSTSSASGNRVKLSAGTGSIDAVTGAGSISWRGSFTSVFYGGLTYWSASNPTLTVDEDGNGTLKATASGYGAASSQDPDADPTRWEPLPPRPITLATFTNVTLSATGFTATPEYLGVEVQTGDGTTQTRTGENWGSFPQDFVDFQFETGQSSYWYSSGGARDAAKPAAPLSVSYAVSEPAEVTVSETTLNADGTSTVTVTGKNFDPTRAIGTRPPFAGAQSGTYIAFGRYADHWRPSQGGSGRNNPTGDNGNGAAVKWAVPAASFPGGPPPQDPTSPSYTELKTDGTFSTEIKVDQSWLASADGNFGIYTYAGGGPTVAAYETYTPLTFEASAPQPEPKADSTTTLTAPAGKHGVTGTATVTVKAEDANASGTVTLTGDGSTRTATLVNGAASFNLTKTLAAKRYNLKATYNGTAAINSSSATASYSVAKGAATAKTSKTTRPTTKKKGSSRVTLTSTGLKATGKVRVLLTKSGKTYRSTTGILGSNGRVRVTLPKLNKKGTWNVVVRYYGDTNHVSGDSKKTTIKVTK